MATMHLKPEKPCPGFPLFPHARGYWAKKIDGKLHYFGSWDDALGALAKYNEFRDKHASQRVRTKQLTKPATADKPDKPSPDFPLFAHRSGQWAKKIRGRTHYFGPWADSEGALNRFLDEKDDLLAGRKPRSRRDGVTVLELTTRFLESKEALVESGELARRTFDDYRTECRRIVGAFGDSRLVEDLAPDDFEALRQAMAKSYGPVALGNSINRIRIIFKYGFDQHLVEKQIRYGQAFKRPTAKTLRIERAKKGKRLFEAGQIRGIFEIATKSMKAMTLLGINAGFGNSDCATLPLSALDFENGWLDYPRPKTGIDRRCKLWPETVDALKAVIAARRKPKEESHAGLVFITRQGDSWGSDIAAVTKEFDKLLKRLEIKRRGLAFYALRHTFQTIGEKSLDAAAVRFIMGHAPASNDMSSLYREEIDDDRLQHVANYVHDWLFRP